MGDRTIFANGYLDEEDWLHLRLELLDRTHQRQCTRHYCTGCGWPNTDCVCRLDDVIAAIENRAFHS